MLALLTKFMVSCDERKSSYQYTNPQGKCKYFWMEIIRFRIYFFSCRLGAILVMLLLEVHYAPDFSCTFETKFCELLKKIFSERLLRNDYERKKIHGADTKNNKQRHITPVCLHKYNFGGKWERGGVLACRGFFILYLASQAVVSAGWQAVSACFFLGCSDGRRLCDGQAAGVGADCIWKCAEHTEIFSSRCESVRGGGVLYRAGFAV